jgi:hypothetical protein
MVSTINGRTLKTHKASLLSLKILCIFQTSQPAPSLLDLFKRKDHGRLPASVVLLFELASSPVLISDSRCFGQQLPLLHFQRPAFGNQKWLVRKESAAFMQV